MPTFKIEGENLEEIREESFDLERDIQKITEKNLKKIFGLELIRGSTKGGEFTLNNLRVDTLAFDGENKSFVIIEYKKDKNISVIDQGYAYLALLLNNKAEFILEYNKSFKMSFGKEDIDWSQSKVIFISPTFTEYQKQAINFRDLPIELWEVKKFSNSTVLFNQLKSPETSESITKISQKSEVVKEVSEEVKVYTEEDHIKNSSEESLEIYNELKSKILNLGDDISIKPRKWYIGFVRNTNFSDVLIQKSQIKLFINLRSGELNDPQNLTRDLTKPQKVGHWGNGDYEILINDLENLDYIISLVKQSYDKN